MPLSEKDIKRIEKLGYKKDEFSIVVDGVRVYDIAPTILHMFGLPIPSNMDGRVLLEIFDPDSDYAKRTPRIVDPSYYTKLRLTRRARKLRRELLR